MVGERFMKESKTARCHILSSDSNRKLGNPLKDPNSYGNVRIGSSNENSSIQNHFDPEYEKHGSNWRTTLKTK